MSTTNPRPTPHAPCPTITYPPRHYVRRSELVVWLQEELGICPWQTRQLIERGVIRRHALSCFKREGRYVPREVAAVLDKSV